MRIGWKALHGLAFVFLYTAITTTAFATNYYVNQTGKDSNSGTSPDKGWRSIGKVNSVTFSPGDSIYFKGGETFTGNLTFDQSDASTPGLPITITSYGTGRALIDAGSGTGLLIYNAGGFAVSNLNFVGSGRTSNTGRGISFYMDLPNNVKLDYVRIDRVDVSGFGKDGLEIGSWDSVTKTKSGFRGVRITNALVHDNGRSGIRTYGYFDSSSTAWAHQNVYIGYSKAYNNTGIPNIGSNTGEGITIGDVDGAVVEYCETYNNGTLNNYSGNGPVGIWAWDANNVTFQYNESHHNKRGTGKDGGGFDFDGGTTNSVMQYNYSHDNEGAGYLLAQSSGARAFGGNIVRYNISQNDGRAESNSFYNYGAIHLWSASSGGIRNSRLYNNTVYVSPGTRGSRPAVYVKSTVSNVQIFNNIFVTTNGLPLIKTNSTSPGATFRGNNYFSGGTNFNIQWNTAIYTSLSAWRSATGQERHNSADVGSDFDPQLTAPGSGATIGDPSRLASLTAYQLQDTSPLRETGLDIASLFGVNPGCGDYYGNILPQGASFDVGAHESSVGQNASQLGACLFSPATSVTPGVSSAINWRTNNATTVSLDQGIGAVPASGLMIVEPSATTTYVLTAVNDVSSVAKSVTLTPVRLISLSLSSSTIAGCKTTTGKVTLSAPVPAGGAIVTIANGNAAAAMPASVKIPVGSSSASFTISSTPVSASQQGNVTASYNGVSYSKALTVRPIGVYSLSLSPNPVVGPNAVTGTVTLECAVAPNAIVVSLSSSNAAVAQPTVASITIPAGSKTGTFTIKTVDVSASSSAYIYAKANGTTKSVKLTVN